MIKSKPKLNQLKTTSYKVYKPYRPLSSYIKNSGMIVFVVLVGLSLVACVMLLNGILRYTYGGDDSVKGNATTVESFDQNTMQKVDKLNSSSQNTITNPSLGAKNPFTE